LPFPNFYLSGGVLRGAGKRGGGKKKEVVREEGEGGKGERSPDQGQSWHCPWRREETMGEKGKKREEA